MSDNATRCSFRTGVEFGEDKAAGAGVSNGSGVDGPGVWGQINSATRAESVTSCKLVGDVRVDCSMRAGWCVWGSFNANTVLRQHPSFPCQTKLRPNATGLEYPA